MNCLRPCSRCLHYKNYRDENITGQRDGMQTGKNRAKMRREMDILRISVLGIAGVLLAVLLQKEKSEYSMFISMAVCICIFIYIIGKVETVIDFAKNAVVCCGGSDVYHTDLKNGRDHLCGGVCNEYLQRCRICGGWKSDRTVCKTVDFSLKYPGFNRIFRDCREFFMKKKWVVCVACILVLCMTAAVPVLLREKMRRMIKRIIWTR